MLGGCVKTLKGYLWWSKIMKLCICITTYVQHTVQCTYVSVYFPVTLSYVYVHIIPPTLTSGHLWCGAAVHSTELRVYSRANPPGTVAMHGGPVAGGAPQCC